MLKRFLHFCLALVLVLSANQHADAANLQADFDLLARIVEAAADNLSIDADTDSKRFNQQQFLARAEQKLDFAQLSMNRENFLDQNLLNLGLYLLAVEFRRAKAAKIILLKALKTVEDSTSKSWLKKKLELIEILAGKNEYADEWRQISLQNEIDSLKKAFANYGFQH